ncbi:hypothetical protein OSB04_025704 [Centaurea solstitialis]|uniref:S-acyltransferase n=1 Tax=Centaurea solstitialis TaxID=347529 RepID=A0AA38T707_9ASTR|nr:hypothetical protein OSB04_025704 [Centaurea solstitialis]
MAGNHHLWCYRLSQQSFTFFDLLIFQKFFLGGRLIFGPDARSLPATVLLIIVPVITFCIFVGRHLRHEFSSYSAGYAVIVAAIIFTIYLILDRYWCFFFLLHLGIPGSFLVTHIRPRKSYDMTTQRRTKSAEDKHRAYSSLEPKRLWLTGFPLGLSIVTPACFTDPRVALTVPFVTIAWSGSTTTAPGSANASDWYYFALSLLFLFSRRTLAFVGQRNYRFFFLFVSSATLLCVYVFSMSAFYIKVLMNDYQSTVWKAMKESPASVALMAYCFISLWFVGGLTGFHLYLISSNQTTYENFRYRADNRYNVYNRGCVNNLVEVFCTKIKPSRNKFRAVVEEEVQRVGGCREEEVQSGPEDRRMKVEDDVDIGGDLLKMSSQRHNIEDIESDIRSRGSEQQHNQGDLAAERRRQSSWDFSPEVVAMNSSKQPQNDTTTTGSKLR